MIKGIVTVAPALNLRVALWNLVDYIDEAMMAADEEGHVGVISIENILEVVTQSMVALDYELDDEFHVSGHTDNGDYKRIINEEEIEKFKKLLGIEPDENNKEETND